MIDLTSRSSSESGSAEDLLKVSARMTRHRFNGNFNPIYDQKCWSFGDEIHVEDAREQTIGGEELFKRYSSISFKGIPCELQAQDVLEDLCDLQYIYLHSTLRSEPSDTEPRIYHCMLSWDSITDFMVRFILPYGKKLFLHSNEFSSTLLIDCSFSNWK